MQSFLNNSISRVNQTFSSNVDNWVSFADNFITADAANIINNQLNLHRRIVRVDFCLINNIDILSRNVPRFGWFGTYAQIGEINMIHTTAVEFERDTSHLYAILARRMNNEFNNNVYRILTYESQTFFLSWVFGQDYILYIPFAIGQWMTGNNRREFLVILIYAYFRMSMPIFISFPATIMFEIYCQMFAYRNTILDYRANMQFDQGHVYADLDFFVRNHVPDRPPPPPPVSAHDVREIQAAHAAYLDRRAAERQRHIEYLALTRIDEDDEYFQWGDEVHSLGSNKHLQKIFYIEFDEEQIDLYNEKDENGKDLYPPYYIVDNGTEMYRALANECSLTHGYYNICYTVRFPCHMEFSVYNDIFIECKCNTHGIAKYMYKTFETDESIQNLLEFFPKVENIFTDPELCNPRTEVVPIITNSNIAFTMSTKVKVLSSKQKDSLPVDFNIDAAFIRSPRFKIAMNYNRETSKDKEITFEYMQHQFTARMGQFGNYQDMWLYSINRIFADQHTFFEERLTPELAYLFIHDFYAIFAIKGSLREKYKDLRDEWVSKLPDGIREQMFVKHKGYKDWRLERSGFKRFLLTLGFIKDIPRYKEINGITNDNVLSFVIDDCLRKRKRIDRNIVIKEVKNLFKGSSDDFDRYIFKFSLPQEMFPNQITIIDYNFMTVKQRRIKFSNIQQACIEYARKIVTPKISSIVYDYMVYICQSVKTDDGLFVKPLLAYQPSDELFKPPRVYPVKAYFNDLGKVVLEELESKIVVDAVKSGWVETDEEKKYQIEARLALDSKKVVKEVVKPIVELKDGIHWDDIDDLPNSAKTIVAHTAFSDINFGHLSSVLVVQYEFFRSQMLRMVDPNGVVHAIFNIACWMFAYLNINLLSITKNLIMFIYEGILSLMRKLSPTFENSFMESVREFFTRDTTPIEIINNTQATTVVHTSKITDFFLQLRKSEFSNVLQNFLLAASACTGLILLIPGMNKHHAQMVFGLCGSIIALPTLVEAISSLSEIVSGQIAPAILHRDMSYIIEDQYKIKISCIHLALNADANFSDAGRYRHLLSEWHKTDIYNDADDFQIFSNARIMIKEMREFLDKYHTADCRKLNVSLIPVDEHLRNCLRTSRRHMPLGICIAGDPNIGKTTLVKILTSELSGILKIRMKRNEDGAYEPPDPYTMQFLSPFQENAHPSDQVVLFDDFAQTINKASNIADAMQAIFDIMSSVKVPITMAALDRKVDNFWGNTLTFVTSNDVQFGTTGNIFEPEAFYRRFPLRIIARKSEDKRSVNYTIYKMRYGYPNSDFETIIIDKGTQEEREHIISDIAREVAREYIAHREKDASIINKRILVCNVCKDNMRHCKCAPPIEVSLPSNTMSFFYNYIMSIKNDTDLITQYDATIVLTLFEELIISTLIFCFPEYIFIWLFIRFLGDIIGRGSNYSMNIDIVTLFMIFMLTFLPIYTGCLLTVPIHIAYNLLVMNLSQLLTANTMWFCAMFGCKYVLKLDKPVESILREAVMDELIPKWKDIPWSKFFIYSIGSLSVLKFSSMIYNYATVQKTAVTNTGFNTIATPEDIKESNDLQEGMIKAHNVQPNDGCANSFKNKFLDVTLKSRGGTLTCALTSSVLKLHTVSRKGMFEEFSNVAGFYTQGYIWTCKHMKEKLTPYAKTTISFLLRKDGPIIELNMHSSKFIDLEGDVTLYPCSIEGKTVLPLFNYTPSMDDVLMYKDKEFPLKSLIKDVRLLRNSFCIDAKTCFGESGLPIFLIRKNGRNVEPRLVGIQSMMDLKDNYPIFCPLVRIGEAKDHIVLESDVPVDPNELKIIQTSLSIPVRLDMTADYHTIIEEFSEMGFNIVRRLHSNSELRHLGDEFSLPELLDKLGWVGELEGAPKRNFTSSFKRSPIYDKVIQAYMDYDLDYVIPDLNRRVDKDGVYRSPSLAGLRQMANRSTIVNQTPYWDAADIVYDEMYKHMKDDLDFVEPLDVDQMIRGTNFMNPLNVKAGLGFPFFKGTKDDIFSLDVSTGKYVFKSWFAREMTSCYTTLDAGRHVRCVAIGITKDELLKSSKNANAMNRQFYAGNVHFLMLCRQYLGPFMDIMMKRRNKLFGQIGMNAVGKEFHNRLFSAYQEITGDTDFIKFLQDKGWLDSDYSKYDKRLLVLLYALYVMWKLVNVSPFYQDPDNVIHLQRIKLILEGLQQYVVIIGSDVFLTSEGICSGVFGTAPINCICEAILEVVQFYFCLYRYHNPNESMPGNFVQFYRDKFPFFKLIKLYDYGDDNIKFVHRSVRYVFTHNAIQMFAMWSGMPITPAQKDENEIDFKVVEKLTFLKRTPTYSKECDCLVGKLEKTSILKSLLFTDSNDPDWLQSVLIQAQREMSFHGYYEYRYFCEHFIGGDFKPQDEMIKEILESDNYIWFDVREDKTPIMIENSNIDFCVQESV